MTSNGKKMRVAKWMIGTVFALLAVLSLGAGTYVFHSVLCRKDRNRPSAAAHDLVGATMQAYTEFGDRWLNERGVNRLKLHTEDGVDLQGYFVPAGTPTNKLAVLVHGYGVDARMMAPYGAMYHDMGFNVFLADDRGNGRSGGSYVGMGWLDRLDYLQWVQLLIGRLGPQTEVVLHGVSMGGATVMMMSGEKLPPQVKCIVEDAGYASVSEEIDHQLGLTFHVPSFPIREIASAESRVFAGYSFEEASAVKQVRKSTTPILFIHGGADTFNPTSMVYEVYGAAQSAKQLLIVPGAMHAMSFHDAPALYGQTVRAFTTKYVKQG